MAESYYQVLSEAVAFFAEKGFTSEDEVRAWTERLRRAAEASLIPEADMVRQLREALTATYKRLVDGGQLLQLHPGISRFTYQRIAPRLRNELDRRIFASADLIKLNRRQAIDDTIKRLSGWITSVPPGGMPTESRRERTLQVRKPLAALPFRERRVIIDQGAKLVSAISETLAVDGGALAGQWRSVHRPGYKNRPEHLARDPHAGHRDGKVYVVRGNWAISEKLMTKGAGYTDEIERPAQLPYCFPGDTRVPFADGVRKGYRHWYSGDLTTIITDAGETLSATPNHPVLTPRGWVAIGALNEGDQIVKAADQRLSVLKPDDDQAVPSIAEIFASLDEGGIAGRVGGAAEQFHGDGSDSDVDVVAVERPLRFGRKASRGQGLQQLGLAVAQLGRAAIGAPDAFLMGCARAAASFMRCLGDALALIGGRVPVAEFAGFDAAAQRYAAFPEALGKSGTGRAEGLREREQAFPFEVATAKVVQVERRAWAGHVYNLETTGGWYVAQGIIVHNCSCRYTWIYTLAALPEDILTRKGKERLEAARALARA